MRKKPLPSMARSRGFCVEVMSPWANDRVVVAFRTPRPICKGSGRPPPCAVGAVAERMVSESRSSKSARARLKPVVLLLARLLAITSSLVCWASIPVAAV
jgi:hypothetical protein